MPQEQQNKFAGVDDKYLKLFDSHCEIKVRKTNQHPNCEYIFSCEEMEELRKDTQDFLHQEITQALQKQVGEIEEGLPKEYSDAETDANGTTCNIMCHRRGSNKCLEQVQDLLSKYK